MTVLDHASLDHASAEQNETEMPDVETGAETDPVAPGQQKRRWTRVAAWLLIGLLFVAVVGGYSVMLGWFWQPALQHPDANGYWAQASLIADSGRTWFAAGSDAQYIGMHWLLGPESVDGTQTFLSRYPPGLPLLIAGVYAAFGWQASLLVNPAFAVLTLVGVFAVVCHVRTPLWAILAMVLTATNAAFTEHALTNISHMAVAFCLTWAIFALLRWSRTKRLRWAFAAGLLVGCIPTARYADAVVALGVLLFALWQVRQIPRLWKHFGAALLGAAVPIVPMLIRNQLLLGGFWKTGYSLTGEQTGFSWDYFTDHAIGYVQMLQSTGAGVLFLLGVLGIAWMFAVRERRALGILLAGCALPLLLLYMSYYWAPGIGGGPFGGFGNDGGRGNMRFLVPIVPLLAISGVWMLGEAVRFAPAGVKTIVPAAVLLISGLLTAPALAQTLHHDAEMKLPLALTTRALEDVAPVGSVVLGNPRLEQHLDFVRKWKVADNSVVARRGWMWFGRQRGGDGEDAGPSPMQREKIEARMANYDNSGRSAADKFRDDLRAWAGDKPVFIVGTSAELDDMIPGTNEDDFEVVRRFRIPEPPHGAENDDRDGRGGRGGRRGNRRRFAGGIFGPFAQPGDEIIIARWNG